MYRPKLTRPTVELFSDGEIFDVNMLHRAGAFIRPMYFPFRRIKTFPDHMEIYFRDCNRPPQLVLIEHTGLHLGGARPWFVCYRCRRRCAKLYPTGVDYWCRRCSDLRFASQRQRLKKRLAAKAKNIRNRLWTDASGKLVRPRLMYKTTYRRHLNALQRIEHAIRHGLHVSSRRYRRYRERDNDGRYSSGEHYEQNDLGRDT
jgi:hypothetical protein